MPDNQDDLIRENERLRSSRDSWRGVAIAVILMTFMVIIPMSMLINEGVKLLMGQEEDRRQRLLKERIEKDLERQFGPKDTND